MMELQASVLVSGRAVTAHECPKCGRRKARGVYMVREQDGRHIFKCDICGQKRSMGWTEASHMLMVEEKEDIQKSQKNRERWRREFTEKFEEDFSEATENIVTTPDAVENFNQMIKGPHLDRTAEEVQDEDE